MLEFTLLGYCLRRSSFKLWIVRGQHQPSLPDTTFSSVPEHLSNKTEFYVCA